MLFLYLLCLGCDDVVVPSYPDTIQSWGKKTAPIPLELVFRIYSVEDSFFNQLAHESSKLLPELVADANPRIRAMAYLAYLKILPNHLWLSVLKPGFADEAELTFSLNCATFTATLGDVLLNIYLDSDPPFLGPLALYLLTLPDEFTSRTVYLRDQLPAWFISKYQNHLRLAVRAGDYAPLAPLATLGNPADQEFIANALIRLQQEPFHRDQAISVLRACRYLPEPGYLPHLLNILELTHIPNPDPDLDSELYPALALYRDPVVQKLFKEFVSGRKAYALQIRLPLAIPEDSFDFFEETLQVFLIDFDTTGAMNRFLWTQQPQRLKDALADWRYRNPHSRITIESLIQKKSPTLKVTSKVPRSRRFRASSRVFNINPSN